MPPELDCVVVGAGLVGAVAAVALERGGLRVGAMDCGRMPGVDAPDPDMRALVVSEASRRVLAGLGLWEALAGRAHPVMRIHVTERGAFGSARLDAREAGLDALGWAVPADVLRASLVEGAQRLLGDRLSFGARYRRHRPGADRVVVELDDARGTSEVNARLLIGADGNGSAVRRTLGEGVDAFDYDQHAIVANVRVSRPLPGTAFERFTARGPIAMIPLDGARYVSVQCLPRSEVAEALALDDDAYGDLLGRRFGTRLGSIGDAGPRHAHALIRQRARSITGVRAALVGNAANAMHPNAAQGWNLGVRDVSALARALATADDPGAPDVLADYAKARRADHARTVGFTDLLAQGYRTDLGMAVHARRAGLLAVGAFPGLRRWLVGEATGLAALARER